MCTTSHRTCRSNPHVPPRHHHPLRTLATAGLLAGESAGFLAATAGLADATAGVLAATAGLVDATAGLAPFLLAAGVAAAPGFGVLGAAEHVP